MHVLLRHGCGHAVCHTCRFTTAIFCFSCLEVGTSPHFLLCSAFSIPSFLMSPSVTPPDPVGDSWQKVSELGVAEAVTEKGGRPSPTRSPGTLPVPRHPHTSGACMVLPHTLPSLSASRPKEPQLSSVPAAHINQIILLHY